MKIKLLKDTRVLMPAGSEVEVDETHAKWLLANGVAAPAELPKPVKKPAKKTTKKD